MHFITKIFLQGCPGDGDQACSQAQIRLLEASFKKDFVFKNIFQFFL
jgi:hypothetical protein